MAEQVYTFGNCGESHHVRNLLNAGLTQPKIDQIPQVFTASQLQVLGFSDTEIQAVIRESHPQAGANTDDLFA